MRTTVNIDDHLLEWAKEVAKVRDMSLGELVDQALQRLLTDPLPADGPELPVFEGEDRGLHPGIDPTSNRSLFDAADDLAAVLRLR